jgi:Uma2 family endonuclease
MPEHLSAAKPREIIYPESDGKPMADNTKQYSWIVTIAGGLNELFKNNPNVFVAGNLLWYPVVGHPEICVAPDALVVFGRPKGYRGSYRQWAEENVHPQAVFEVLSPSNDALEMKAKQAFYDRYGVEEYYIYDPDSPLLTGWIRLGERLEPIAQMKGWVSPSLEIRFELDGPGGELKIYRPDGRAFASYEELTDQRDQEQQERQRADQRAEQERQRAEQERQRADQAEQRLEQTEQAVEQERQERQRADQRAEQERQRAERLLAQLRAAGITFDE